MKLAIINYFRCEIIRTGVSPIGKWSRLVLNFLFMKIPGKKALTVEEAPRASSRASGPSRRPTPRRATPRCPSLTLPPPRASRPLPPPHPACKKPASS